MNSWENLNSLLIYAGGVTYAWTSWRTLVPLILGPLGLLVFIAWSIYGVSEPLIRGSIFEAPTAKTGYFGTTVHGTIVWSLLYFVSHRSPLLNTAS